MGEGETLVAFDVGNSALKCAVSTGGTWTVLFRIPTRPVDTLGGRLAESLSAHEESLPTGRRRWVASSVCPDADEALAEDCRRRGVAGPELFGRDLSIPIPTLTQEPSKVGTDRLLCALGARELVGAPCIAVGAGTAITVDLVDGEGRFAGGAIAPGFSLSAQALYEGTACLPLIEPEAPQRTAGLDTTEAMQSGICRFCRGGVESLIALLSRESGTPGIPVVVTGGDASLLLPLEVDVPVREVPELVFIGMAAAL